MVMKCALVIIFVVYIQPFDDPFMNKLEAFNEVCILAASYHLLVFNDFVRDADLQYMAGWSIIGVTLFNMAFNMIIMFYATFLNFKRFIRKLRYKVSQYISRKKQQKYALQNQASQNTQIPIMNSSNSFENLEGYENQLSKKKKKLSNKRKESLQRRKSSSIFKIKNQQEKSIEVQREIDQLKYAECLANDIKIEELIAENSKKENLFKSNYMKYMREKNSKQQNISLADWQQNQEREDLKRAYSQQNHTQTNYSSEFLKKQLKERHVVGGPVQFRRYETTYQNPLRKNQNQPQEAFKEEKNEEKTLDNTQVGLFEQTNEDVIIEDILPEQNIISYQDYNKQLQNNNDSNLNNKSVTSSLEVNFGVIANQFQQQPIQSTQNNIQSKRKKQNKNKQNKIKKS